MTQALTREDLEKIEQRARTWREQLIGDGPVVPVGILSDCGMLPCVDVPRLVKRVRELEGWEER